MSETDTSPQKANWLGWLQVAIVVIVLLVALYFMRAPQIANFDDLAAPVNNSLPVVDVIQPRAQSDTLKVRLTGSVQVRSRVNLEIGVTGRVIEVSPNLRPGKTFEAGETLVKVDPANYESAVRAAEAEVRSLEARMRKNVLQGELDAAEYRRANPNQAVPEIIRRQPQIDRFKARVERSQAQLERAQKALDDTSFSLPFRGKVLATDIAVGERVSPLLRFGSVYPEGETEVGARISLEDLRKLEPVIGRPGVAQTEFQAYPVIVDRVSQFVTPESRMAQLFLKFDDSVSLEDKPLPGDFVAVVVVSEEIENIYTLPHSAEQLEGNVWVVDDGVLKSITPRVHGMTRDAWLVAAFDAEDGVVIGSIPGAREGMPVQISEAGDSQ